MGCDIHLYLETKSPTCHTWTGMEINIDWRCYGVFGWLANVRNYSAVPKTTATFPGTPTDVSPEVQESIDQWGGDVHHHHYANLNDLLAVDYTKEVWDRRVTRGGDGGCTTNDPNEGVRLSLNDFLGPWTDLLQQLKIMAEGQEARIVFFFDN